jgi:hypothetical protein
VAVCGLQTRDRGRRSCTRPARLRKAVIVGEVEEGGRRRRVAARVRNGWGDEISRGG